MGFGRYRAGQDVVPHVHTAGRVRLPLHAASRHEGRARREAAVKRLVAVLAGAACGVVGAFAVACFSDRGAGPSVNPAAECTVPVSVIDSMHYVVAIENFGFHPDSIAVPVGATVTWVNCEPNGTESHTTTSNTGVWCSSDIKPGARFSFKFAAQGAFPYHCTPHPFMTAKVIVQ